MPYFLFGEVFFASTRRRDKAQQRVVGHAGRLGFTAEAWAELGAGWPAGVAQTPGSPPGLRFCYATTDSVVAAEVSADISAAWDSDEDSPSWWGYQQVPG